MIDGKTREAAARAKIPGRLSRRLNSSAAKRARCWGSTPFKAAARAEALELGEDMVGRLEVGWTNCDGAIYERKMHLLQYRRKMLET